MVSGITQPGDSMNGRTVSLTSLRLGSGSVLWLRRGARTLGATARVRADLGTWPRALGPSQHTPTGRGGTFRFVSTGRAELGTFG